MLNLEIKIHELEEEIKKLKSDKEKLLDVLRPVAIIGNRAMHRKDIWEFLSPNGYRNAYLVYKEMREM